MVFLCRLHHYHGIIWWEGEFSRSFRLATQARPYHEWEKKTHGFAASKQNQARTIGALAEIRNGPNKSITMDRKSIGLFGSGYARRSLSRRTCRPMLAIGRDTFCVVKTREQVAFGVDKWHTYIVIAQKMLLGSRFVGGVFWKAHYVTVPTWKC